MKKEVLVDIKGDEYPIFEVIGTDTGRKREVLVPIVCDSAGVMEYDLKEGHCYTFGKGAMKDQDFFVVVGNELILADRRSLTPMDQSSLSRLAFSRKNEAQEAARYPEGSASKQLRERQEKEAWEKADRMRKEAAKSESVAV